MSSISEWLYDSSPAWFQSVLVSAYGYKLYRKRYSGLYSKVLSEICESRQWSKEQISQHQNESFFDLVKHCRQHIPYYQLLFSEYGFSESNFTSISDITKLPVLSKQTLRDNAQLFQWHGTTPYMVQHTSGSTGTPLSLWTDEYTYKMAMALLVGHEELHGVPFGARRATFAGRMLQSVNNNSPPFSRYNRAENQRLFSSYHINSNNFSHYKKELNAFSPEELIGYPSAIYELACQFELASESPSFQPRAIVTNSETLTDWQRPVIERVFRCPVWDYYGTAEYILFASQCNDGSYHINPLIGIVETVDHKDNPVSNVAGEVVATTLTNKSMPLLRYKIGDRAVLSDSDCKCGDYSRFFTQIEGRNDDVIITSDGRRIGRIDHIFKGLNAIKEAQVIQDRVGHCLIKVVKSQGGCEIDETTLLSNMTGRTGSGMEVDIQYVDKIERGANGKFKSVIQNLGK